VQRSSVTTTHNLAVDHIRRVARETAEQSGYRAAAFALMQLPQEYRIMPLTQKEAPADRRASCAIVCDAAQGAGRPHGPGVDRGSAR